MKMRLAEADELLQRRRCKHKDAACTWIPCERCRYGEK